MDKDEFRKWRENFGLTQAGVGERLGVSRNTVQNWEYGLSPLPGSLADACEVWGNRLRKEIAELGPVTLCYTDGPMFVDPYGPRRKLAMLKQEPYLTNAAAIARVKIIWHRPDVHGPFIIEKSGEMLWNQVELTRVVDGTDKGAPTVRNTIAKIATYVAENSTAFARVPRPLPPAETKERTQHIIEIGKELERLSDESENREVKYSEFEALLERLHKLAFYPTNRQVGDVSQAIMGEEVARAVA
jgi:transcriptional regulator with XRE-family HTH domain